MRAPPNPVRRAAVAGTWYPADPRALAAAVDGCLAAAGPLPDVDATALIAPHAGLVYSGPVAAHAWAAVRGRAFDAVVLVGPSHHVGFDGVSICGRGASTSTRSRPGEKVADIVPLVAASALCAALNNGSSVARFDSLIRASACGGGAASQVVVRPSRPPVPARGAVEIAVVQCQGRAGSSVRHAPSSGIPISSSRQDPISMATNREPYARKFGCIPRWTLATVLGLPVDQGGDDRLRAVQIRGEDRVVQRAEMLSASEPRLMRFPAPDSPVRPLRSRRS